MDIRKMTSSDVPKVIEGWNSVLIHDRLSEDEFRKTILDKPDYDPNGTFVSVEGESVIGFITTPATGGEQGFIAAYYVRPQYIENQVPGEILQCAEDYVKAQGVMRVKVAGYDNLYLAPGVDLCYDFLLTCYQRAGYEWKGTADDMECELGNWKPTAYQQDKIRQAKDYDVRVVDYTEFTPETLREWSKRAAKHASWDWFWEWWEYGPTMFVAVRRSRE